jgi:hypothetical protein
LVALVVLVRDAVVIFVFAGVPLALGLGFFFAAGAALAGFLAAPGALRGVVLRAAAVFLAGFGAALPASDWAGAIGCGWDALADLCLASSRAASMSM